MLIRSQRALLVIAACGGLILSSCSQPSSKRSDTAASADDEGAADGASDALKKVDTETTKKTPTDSCAGGASGTLTANVSGTPQALPLDDGNTTPTTQTGTGSGTAAGDVTARTQTPSDCNATPLGAGSGSGTAFGSGNGAGTGVTTGTGTGSGTTAANPGPSVPPPGLLYSGKTLEQCNAEGKAWVPSSTGEATCGDPLVTWCCSMAEVANQFPSYATQLGTVIQNYESSGRKLYHCSYANSKFTMYFAKGSAGGLSFASSYLVGVPPTPKAAATKCALPTSASLGL